MVMRQDLRGEAILRAVLEVVCREVEKRNWLEKVKVQVLSKEKKVDDLVNS